MKQSIFLSILVLTVVACNNNSVSENTTTSSKITAKTSNLESTISPIQQGKYNIVIHPSSGKDLVFGDTSKNMVVKPSCDNKRLAFVIYEKNQINKLAVRISATKAGSYPIVIDQLAPDSKPDIASAFAVNINPENKQQTDYYLNNGTLTINEFNNHVFSATIKANGVAKNYTDKTKNLPFTLTATFDKIDLNN